MTARQDLGLQQHPLSAAFPSMPDGEIEALAIDIEKHGQREPGVTLDGMVLDGWHRYLACQKAGSEFVSVPFSGADPVAFVISRNLHRRHLTASQRVAAVAQCASWAPAHRPDKGGTGSPLMTNAQIADAADASVKTVKQVKAAIRAGLGDAVKEGMVSAKDAAALASGKSQGPSKPKADPRDAEIKKLSDALAEANEKVGDLADTARELEDKLTAYEAKEPDEQQKEIMKLQKKVVRLEAEIERLTIARNDAQNKNNELIRQVKLLQRKTGGR